MKIFFEPVNLLQWNIFEKVKSAGHIEPFLATKSMKMGDLVILHVGKQKRGICSGVYAYGKIIKEPCILENSPTDYCNNKNTVDVEILRLSYSTPLIDEQECKLYFKQFRTVHKIDDTHYSDIFKKIF